MHQTHEEWQIMNYIYLNTVKGFINENSRQILNIFKNNFRTVYDDFPNLEQVKAWESSISYLQSALGVQYIYDLTIIFEYRLPFSNERIDFMIFGSDKNNKPTLLLFELKGWKRAEKITSTIVNSDIGKSVHPEYQVENYAGKLRFSHSEATDFNIVPAVLMYNGTSQTIYLEFKKQVFFKNEGQKLRQFVNHNISKPLGSEIIKRTF